MLAFLAGLCMALGHVPFTLPWIALPALAGLFWLLGTACNPKEAALIGWAGGMGHFLLSLIWIVEPFLIEPAKTGWMAPFALFLLPAGLALFWGGAFYLATRLAQGGQRLFLAATLLALAEMSRAFVLTGFPWALIGYIWIDTAPMQMAAMIGPHGLTLATTLIAAALAVWYGRHRVWLAAPVVALVALAVAIFWGVQLQNTPIEERGPAFRLRIVQPNAEQGLKWDPTKADEFLHILLVNTAETPPAAPPELIVWPETALPYLLTGSESLLKNISDSSGDRPVLLGAARREGESIFYNSLVVSGHDGEMLGIYDKSHLVPFGEYVPFGALLSRLGIKGMAVHEGGGFSAGPGPAILDVGRHGKVQPLICYEAIFPQLLHLEDRPDWILHATNDAWFGKLVGPYQHLSQVQLRAVEQGVPVIRAANTGVSAVIDARGRVLDSLGLGVRGFLDVDLPPAIPPTLYSKTGDWPIFILLSILSFGFAFPFRRMDY